MSEHITIEAPLAQIEELARLRREHAEQRRLIAECEAENEAQANPG